MCFVLAVHTTQFLRQWLSLRVRLVCIGVMILGSVLPPYIPPSAFATQDVPAASPQFLLVEDGFLMKSSSFTGQGARRAYAEGLIHTIREGDTLEHLADRYGISVETIRWTNNLGEKDTIRPGNELLILPVNGLLHKVHRGQTLTEIAELYDVSAADIVHQNRLKGDFIVAGQELIIPGGRPIVVAMKEETKTVKEPTPGKERRKGESTVSEAVAIPAIPTVGVLQMPCNDCIYTQYYNPSHFAVDMQTKGGGPVFAAEDGIVMRADEGWNGGYGTVIEIDHGNELVTLYAHNREMYVREGQTVKRGQVIAWMGRTGRVHGPTGVHVHFEVRVRGVKKNPLLYLQ